MFAPCSPKRKNAWGPILATGLFMLTACGATQSPRDDPGASAAIASVLDDWHAAAAASDEERYFGHFTQDAVFLGTDATERWDVPAFRAYAHPHFAASHGWVLRSVRRDIVVEGRFAWFDEDLDGENLGAARGSGVMRYDGERWQIAQYNLALTIPNERFAAVSAALEAEVETPVVVEPVSEVSDEPVSEAPVSQRSADEEH